jgi:hypothetical protein
MNRLDSVSYYLSYTDFIPVVSIVSGIVHLICAIRDHIFGAAAPVFPQNEGVYDLSKRKLDNWSHSTKGILAIIPLIGNFILFCKWVTRQIELNQVLRATNNGTSKVSQQQLYAKTLAVMKAQETTASVAKGIFQALPEDLKKDSKIVAVAFHKIGVSLVHDIRDKQILLSHFDLCKEALKVGYLEFADLSEQQKNILEYGMAAVAQNANQWRSLPPALQSNATLLYDLVDTHLRHLIGDRSGEGYKTLQQQPWFVECFKGQEIPTTPQQALQGLRERHVSK